MLTILSGEEYDYSYLTSSYLKVFGTDSFQQFLNTTQTGYAHTSSGTELSVLLKTTLSSFFLCTIQLMLFCFLRNIFKTLYQPRCFCVPIGERMAPPEKGFINWVLPTISYSIHYYLSLGLDAYFFVRYINVQLLFFLIIGSINILVLTPVNFYGSDSQYTANGLDKLSISNIAESKVHHLNAHFVMALLTVGFFHWILVYELESVIKIRQSTLTSRLHQQSAISRTVLIKHVPQDLLSGPLLKQALENAVGGVENYWFLDDYTNVEDAVKKAAYLVNILERAEIRYIKNVYRKVERPRYKKFTNLVKLRPLFYPPIFLKWYGRTFVFPGFLRAFIFQKQVDQIQWGLQMLRQVEETMRSEKELIASKNVKRFNSVFIQFVSQKHTYMAHQVLLYSVQGLMDKTIVEVHPRDIQWNNLTNTNSSLIPFQRYLITVASIALTIFYIIPVSFIGLISQVPLITHLIPFMSWIYGLPEEARDCISSILPSILLSVLSVLMMIIFRFLSQYKGKLTGAEIEIDLQRWYFGFLFIQQFLVVTILSSITVILKQVVDQPTSIPVMLATNVPKAATFFFQFISVKALSFCGNNFLRIDQLILRKSYYKFIDKTPREKLKRLTTLLKPKWGTVYPVFSVYGSIGLTYTIISPLISIFIIMILFIALVYYKYSLRYIYSHINESETHGKLYPSALLHLYSGIYCLEFSLIGVFFLLKNSMGDFPMRFHGWVMILILLVTIFGNITIYNRYSKYFVNLPVINRSPENSNDLLNPELKLNYEMLYLHPSLKYEIPKLWLPSDKLGVADEEATRLTDVEAVDAVVTPGAVINFSSSNIFLKISVIDAPPDYK